MNRRCLATTSLALFLTACSTAPSVTDHIGAKNIPDGYEAVSICHDGLAASKFPSEELALENCPEGTSALHLWDQDMLLNSCPILKRNRVTFLCAK